MMVLLVKEYLEEIHGYSLQEAAFIVTIPNNIAQFVLGLCVGSLGDLMIKKEVAVKTVRRVGAGVQILAILPLLILPFLPCEVVSYRATMIVVQVEFYCSSCLWKPFLHRCSAASECLAISPGSPLSRTSLPPSRFLLEEDNLDVKDMDIIQISVAEVS